MSVFLKTEGLTPPAALWESGMEAVGCSSRELGGAGDGPGDVRGTQQDFGQAFPPSPALSSLITF